MSFVFISHASADKHLLAPYLDHLLEQLDSDVELWIDTPENIDKRFSPELEKRVSAIPPGGDWYDAIRKGLCEGGAILLFLSEKSVDASDVLREEIYDGWRDGKLVPVNLDGVSAQRFPELLRVKRIQALDVSKFGTDKDDLQFDRAISGIKTILDDKRDVDQKPAIAIEHNMLPYLIDRHSIRQIAKNVDEQLNGGDKAARASLYLVPGDNDDYIDMYGKRLIRKEGPEECRLPCKEGTPGWVYKFLKWENRWSADNIISEFERLHADTISIELASAMYCTKPICFETEYCLDNLSDLEVKGITSWILFWEQRFPELQQKVLDRNKEKVSVPVVILMTLRLDELGLFASNRKVAGLAQKIPRALGLLKHVNLTILPRLSQIEKKDAQNWTQLEEIQGGGLLDEVLDFVRDRKYSLFPKAGFFSKKKFKSISMAEFRHRLKETSFWDRDQR